jgi:hypothetical protein
MRRFRVYSGMSCTATEEGAAAVSELISRHPHLTELVATYDPVTEDGKSPNYDEENDSSGDSSSDSGSDSDSDNAAGSQAGSDDWTDASDGDQASEDGSDGGSDRDSDGGSDGSGGRLTRKQRRALRRERAQRAALFLTHLARLAAASPSLQDLTATRAFHSFSLRS